MELLNFIKYCLGYVKLTRQRTFAAQQRYAVNLSNEYFDLGGLLNGDTDDSLGEIVNLETFYGFDPKEVKELSDKTQKKYEQEKDLANRIEEIYNKYRNDQFTKQITFNFGYFEIEVPIEIEEDSIDAEEAEEEVISPRVKTDKYPLFSIPIKIEKEIEEDVAKYSLFFVDPDVQVNVGMLEPVIGEDLYYQLLEELGGYELDGKLTLPIVEPKIFIEIWHKVKAQLRLKDANFDEESFSLEEMRIALSPRVNYFLAEDLQKLSKFTEEEIKGTALSSWVENEDLNIESEIPEEKDLYFPFLYDKYKLRVLSAISNKSAIVQGPPGTGKSETIANLLCHLAATGKRVLFVSQKAQALKVVKDKLKQLDVKYLFGYIPNPSSAQVGEEDEIDGIAPQLSALNSHIENLGYKFYTRKKLIEYKEDISAKKNSSITAAVEEKSRLKENFTESIERQRRYYQLHQELKQLKDYDITISDLACFRQSFSSPEWKEIKDLKREIGDLKAEIRRYAKNEERRKLDELFSHLELSNKNYSENIGKIKNDIEGTGYDRHSNFLRKINNTLRNLRLKKERTTLPREIIDYIDQVLSADTSRNEAVKTLGLLYYYCKYYEDTHRLKEAGDRLEDRLHTCGVSTQEFDSIDDLLSKNQIGLEEVKDNILRVQEVKKELRELSGSHNINQLSQALKDAENTRSERVALYIQNIVNKNIIEKWKQGVTIKQVIKKLARAFGKTKRAFKTFDNLRKDPDNFNAILDLIPVWIMELDDASRIIPLEAAIFDYLILDEASQCNVAYTLPVMYRSKRALFVGDSEQMRDNTVIFKSNKSFDELARRYQIPEELQIKATGFAVQSVLDIAELRGFPPVPLRYHYRSPAELIGFSNKYFYKPKGKELIPLNNNYLTYKDTERVMLIHEVGSDWKEEFSDKVNVAEAKAILELFRELRGDERYSDRSIGILSFFNAQSTYIRELFEKEGYKEEEDNYKVSIIEGIQGDEKDIIIYSFVIRSPDQKNKYTPLTGEGGDILGDINKGRVNVAFSRARLQTHCFISLPIAQIPEKIWLKKYLEYVDGNGKVDFYSTELKPFDSYFEEEFYKVTRVILKRGYKIQNQVESCGFKIDFVISNTNNGKRLAIECDGPTHFKDEIDEIYGIHIESDEERQRVLEAAGWSFYRIKYSDWINSDFDQKDLIKEVIDLLK